MPAHPESAVASELAVKPLIPASGVKDPVFAVLLGFVLDDHEGAIDSTRVRAEVEAIGRKPKLPYRRIHVVSRHPASTGTPFEEHLVSSRFDREIDLPVPYQILGYHPGSFRSHTELHFREVSLGNRDLMFQHEVKGEPVDSTLNLGDVRLYVLEDGLLEIDIDGWLDRLAGAKLDDTRIAGLVIFRKDGTLFGMALGYNRKGDPRSGTIAFAEDKILYPNPADLKVVARQMRSVLETLSPDVRAEYTGW